MPIDLYRAFLSQRRNAKRRGIEWNLTYQQWRKIWDDSGLLHARGRRGFVMHRLDSAGAYEIGNVEIVSAADNFRYAMDEYYVTRSY